MKEQGGIFDRLKTLGRSALMVEIAPGKWKKVIGPTSLLLTLPFGGKIKLGLDDVEIYGAYTLGSGRCNVAGGGGHYVLNDFDLDQAIFEDT